VAPARPETPCRTREALPDVVVQPLQQEHLAARRGDRDPRRHDAGVVDDDELATPQLVRQLGEAAVSHRAGRAVVDEQPRVAAPRRRMLRDERGRKLVVQLGDVHARTVTVRTRPLGPVVSDTGTVAPPGMPHPCLQAFREPVSDTGSWPQGPIRPTAALPSRAMDPEAIRRAQDRINQAAAGRIDPAALDATLERAREQVVARIEGRLIADAGATVYRIEDRQAS